MLVHFIASKGSILKDYENYTMIRSAVVALGHTMAYDWIDNEHEFIASGKKHTPSDWEKINHENMAALSRADVVIAEASALTFSTGFLVANAIQMKKPTLILTRNNELEGTFGSGIVSDFVRMENYAEDNVDDIIVDFIDQNNIDKKDLRFNFFIDRQIYNYLRWAAYKTGKNKSEILRELVIREIEKKDD